MLLLLTSASQKFLDAKVDLARQGVEDSEAGRRVAPVGLLFHDGADRWWVQASIGFRQSVCTVDVIGQDFRGANIASLEQELTKREIDQKAAIMIVIEHFGDISPGTKCSAVFFDTEKVRREKEFFAKLYSENGVHDPEILRAMVAANVPDEPYWLVSLRSGDSALADVTRLHRVDDRTGTVLADPA